MDARQTEVTIVIPVFNRAELLARAVRSGLGQPCAVEVIVVDDGSTEDISGALEREFAAMLASQTPPCLRLLRQPNQGACAARNAGLAAARGEFVKFLDSDDELLPGALPQEAAAARREGCDALLTAWEERFFRADGAEDPARRRMRPAPRLDHGIDDMLEGKGPRASGALYRREFITRLRWDPEWTKAQDWGWALTVCLAGARFASLDLPSCTYNHHAGARITNRGDPVLRATHGRQFLLRMVERELRAQNALNDERRRKLAQYYYRDCQVLARHDPAEWRRLWNHCRELCPGFRPVEPNLVLRVANRLFGVQAGVRLYVRLKSWFWRPRSRPVSG